MMTVCYCVHFVSYACGFAVHTFKCPTAQSYQPRQQVARRVKWSTIGQVLRFVYKNVFTFFAHLLSQFSLFPLILSPSLNNILYVSCAVKTIFKIFVVPHAIRASTQFPATVMSATSKFFLNKVNKMSRIGGSCPFDFPTGRTLLLKSSVLFDEWKLDPTQQRIN